MLNLTEKFFVECVGAGIKGSTVKAVSQGVDYKKLYDLCVSHAVSAIVYYALKDLHGHIPPNFVQILRTAVEKQVMRDAQSEADMETVSEAFEKRGIRYMPLKGSIVKKLYPRSEMRYCSDSDILIDVAQLKEVRAVYRDIGMCVKRYDEHHDIAYFPYTKSIFEFHKTLFVGKLGEYFGTGFERAKVKDGAKCLYELGAEDFYMTLICHSAYHFSTGGGVGIRHLTDIYVYRNRYTLDEEYLKRESEKCGLSLFRERFEKLAEYFFGGKEADGFTEKLADYVLCSHVLGNEKMREASAVAKSDGKLAGAKIKLIFAEVFPPYKKMSFTYPVLKKAKFLLPFFYPVRWLRVLFKTPKNIGKMRRISKVGKTEFEKAAEMIDGLGLNNAI